MAVAEEIALRTLGNVEQRQIRPHKKSRTGCKNCKLRKVKCDESRPSCTKCRDYGFSCDYCSAAQDFQLSVERVSNIAVDIHNSRFRVGGLTLDAINTQLRSSAQTYVKVNEVHQLDVNDLSLLNTFQTKTIFTFPTGHAIPIYCKELVRLACQHPFLMHMVLGMATTHTRVLGNSPSLEKTPAEAFHWFKATALFNAKLNTGIFPEDRDALWATAILLGVSTFSSCEATRPEDAWPLAPPSAADLNWLRISDGKKEIWKIAKPLRPDSVFCSLARQQQIDYLPCVITSDAVLQTLPAGLVEFYKHHTRSSPGSTNNLYYYTLCALAPLLRSPCNKMNFTKYLSFIAHFDPKFRDLLLAKEPFALLILAYWYAKVRLFEWWISNRAEVECRAICIYLEREHQSYVALQNCIRCFRSAYNIFEASV